MTQLLLPSEMLASATVRIECTVPTGVSTGTAFVFGFLQTGQQHVPAIVTNKHVVKDASMVRFVFTEADAAGQPIRNQKFEISLSGLQSKWIDHPSNDVDLCIFPIGPLHGYAAQQGKKLFYSTLTSRDLPAPDEVAELQAMEDIVMIGYPNGIWDAHNNQPIIRRGVTATHPALDYEGRQEFLIDAACFPGSSGSPVFLYNTNGYLTRSGAMTMGAMRIKLLGILYAGPVYNAKGDIVVMNQPALAKPTAVSPIPINLGVVIKASQLAAFDTLLQTMIASQPRGAP
jgi:hypothetical protein